MTWKAVHKKGKFPEGDMSETWEWEGAVALLRGNQGLGIRLHPAFSTISVSIPSTH